jgi:[ribosomal protein S5]-alanine N-acetyltransferase
VARESFQTDRLKAHRLTRADFQPLRAIHTDAVTMQTLSTDGSVPSEELSRTVFVRHMRHWEQHGFGLWLFSPLSTADVIGYCGLRKYPLRGIEETELFFGLRSEFFRQGFGTEMARAVVTIGFQDINADSIVSFTLNDNVASRALMTKVGMSFEKMIERAGLPHLMYRLKRLCDNSSPP